MSLRITSDPSEHPTREVMNAEREPEEETEERIIEGIASALDYVFECRRSRERESGNANGENPVPERRLKA